MRKRATITVAIGVATGLLAGLLGVGGGLIMVPGMTQLLKMRQHEAVGTSLLVIIPIALVGALVLGQSHDVDPLVGVILAVASIVGAVVGAGLTRTISDRTLRRVFAIAVLVVAVIMLIDAGATMLHAGIGLHPSSRPSGALLVVLGLAIGLVTGVLSGLLGIGGGLVMVPAMVLVLGLSQHLAQGTSLFVIVPTAAAGSVTHLRLGNIRPAVAGWLAIGGIAGAVAGAMLALLVPDQALRILFAVFLLYTGGRMYRQRGAAAVE
jgi:uncharacterized membrane protein YfcA